MHAGIAGRRRANRMGAAVLVIYIEACLGSEIPMLPFLHLVHFLTAFSVADLYERGRRI